MIRNYRKIGSTRTPTISAISSGVSISNTIVSKGLISQPSYIVNKQVDKANITANNFYSKPIIQYEVI